MRPRLFLSYIDPGTGYTIFGGGLIFFLIGFWGLILIFFKRIFHFFKKHYKKILIIIALFIALGVIIKGAFMAMKLSKFDKRLIVLGFDALNPDFLEPMMQEGELPNFSRLKERGAYSRLATTNPSQSPVAWAGFATGKNPGKNGVFDFIIRDPKTYGLDLSLSRFERGNPKRTLKTKAFWQYTSRAGIPTVVITHPVTFPPDKLNGRMLSGMGVPDILGTEGTFTFYTSQSLDTDVFTGGKVFYVRKSDTMVIHLIGPKVSGIAKRSENVKVPLKAQIKDGATVQLEYQKHKTELKVGKWSDWQEVEFDLGFFKKAKGIFKFYLVAAEPQFKLYISPINFDPRNAIFSISYPKNYSRELAERIELYHTQGMPMDTWAVNERRMTEEPFLEVVNEVMREKKAMLDLELARFKKGVLFCYFENLDIIQHMFWRYIDSQHPLYEKNAPQEYREMIRNWYKRMDEVLGEVLAKLQTGDILIVLSDHGFGTFRRAVQINTWLRHNGYLELKNPYVDSGQELLVDIDWPKTKAYSIGFGAIYINQQGRERDGIVKPGQETEALKKEIAEKLEKWVDEKYNQPVVSRVYKREEIFWGDCAEETPDLYIGFNVGYRASWQTAIGGAPKDIIEDNLKKWSGDHLFDPALVPGAIFSNIKLTKKDPALYDITPTILKIVGFDEEELKKADFDGASLF